MKQDVYTRVTDTILAALEQGTRPWMQPWDAAHAAGPVSRPLRHNGTPYKGVNVLMLWLAAMEKGYTAPIWMTYDQAKELGGYVKKNEHGSLVVYANTFKKTETDTATGEDMEVEIPFMKPYSVFNVEQIEGLPAHYYATSTPPTLDAAQRQARLDAFFAATGASIRHGGNRAFYTIGEDYIQMPPFETFHSPESYYATLAHEETHWTRHPSRLDRDLGRKKWGDAGYAMEELVAEIGSAFLCAELGITPEIREDHAAYIASWLKVLEEDKRAIFTAASHAQKAADFLLNLQPSPEPEPEPEPNLQPSPEPEPEPEPNREPAPEPQAQQSEPDTQPERPPAAVAESPTAADPPVPVGQPFNTVSRRADAPPAPATTSAAPARKSPGRRAPRPGQGDLF
ncbi:MAG: zincin-like metallopeptidase domain-containing protein [Thauera sp.]